MTQKFGGARPWELTDFLQLGLRFFLNCRKYRKNEGHERENLGVPATKETSLALNAADRLVAEVWHQECVLTYTEVQHCDSLRFHCSD